MDAQRNKQLMQEVFAALAHGDGGPFVAAMSEDFTWTIAGVATEWAGSWRGKQAVREQLLSPLFSQFADRYTSTAVSFTAEEDRVVVEARGRATTATGETYANQYCYVCRFDEGGKLAELVEYADTALMNERLTPP
jgi:ketosteroid isomerase-like protein